ncbi:MAG: hypothetical protein ACI9WU_003621 [Myxococcota bacterium]|jgi:hypothetical protein
MTDTTRIIYFGERDLDYARIRSAVRGSRRPGITLYRVVDLRQAMINDLFTTETICIVSPRFSPSALLNLLDWRRIYGEMGPVFQLRHVEAGSAISQPPRVLGLRGYLASRDMTTRFMEQFIDKTLGRTLFRMPRKRSVAGGFSPVANR